MKKTLIVLLSAVFVIVSIQIAKAQVEPEPPFLQAAPIIQMLKAMETNDPDMLIESFSQRVQKEHKKYKKEELLELYISSLEGVKLYPFKTEDFTFTYDEVDSEFGWVQFHYKGEIIKDAKMSVKKENGAWKLAEK